MAKARQRSKVTAFKNSLTCIVGQLDDGCDLDAAGLVRVGGGLLFSLDEWSGEEQDVGNDMSSNHVAVDELAIQRLQT